MNLPPLDVPGLLRKYGLRPDRSLGQNFLIDDSALDRVIEASDLHSGEDVLEVGPGLGSLTRRLAAISRRVVAVELDEALLAPLEEVLAGAGNVIVVHGDILALDPARLMQPPPGAPGGEAQRYRVIANIPYYITSAVIRHLLEAGAPPAGLTLTVQREVAERITAGPGELSLLALSVQVYGQPKIRARIPAGAFYPPPKVDSAVIQIELHPRPIFSPPALPVFFRLAKAGFSQKRKTLRNALSAGLAWERGAVEALLEQAALDPQRRAETLSLEEWGRLVQAYQGSIPG